MPCRKHDDLRRTIEKERIDCNGKGIDALLPEGHECCIDLGNGTRVEDYDLPPDIGGRGPNVDQLSIDIRHIRIDENADGRFIGSQLTQEPEPLRLQLGLKPAVAREIAARPLRSKPRCCGEVGGRAEAVWNPPRGGLDRWRGKSPRLGLTWRLGRQAHQNPRRW